MRELEAKNKRDEDTQTSIEYGDPRYYDGIYDLMTEIEISVTTDEEEKELAKRQKESGKILDENHFKERWDPKWGKGSCDYCGKEV